MPGARKPPRQGPGRIEKPCGCPSPLASPGASCGRRRCSGQPWRQPRGRRRRDRTAAAARTRERGGQGGLEVRSLVERVGALVDGVAVHVLHEVAGGAVGEERRLLLGAGEGHLDSLAVGGERLPHVALAEVRIALALVLGSLGLERVDLVVRGVSLVHHRSQLSRILVEPEIGLDTWKDVRASGGEGVSDGGRAARRINREGGIFLATQNPGLLGLRPGHTLSEAVPCRGWEPVGAARESKRERTRAGTGPVIVDDGPGDRAPFGSERRPSRRRARRLRPRPAAKAPNAEKSDIQIACPGGTRSPWTATADDAK